MAPNFWRTKAQYQGSKFKDWSQIKNEKRIRNENRAKMKELTVNDFIDILWIITFEHFSKIDKRELDHNTKLLLRNISYNNQARRKLRSSLEDKCKQVTTNKWTLEIMRALNDFTELTLGEKITSNTELVCGVCTKRSYSFNGWMTSVILKGAKYGSRSEPGCVIAATPDCLKRLEKYHAAEHFLFKMEQQISRKIRKNKDFIHDIKLMIELSETFYSDYKKIFESAL